MRWPLKMLLVVLPVAVVVNAQKQPQFDVAIVRAMPPVAPGVPVNVNLGAINNGTVTLTNVTLSECIQFAYTIVSAAQIAGPDWIKSRDVRFEIVARAAPDVSRDQLLVMLQSLLAHRLKLSVHHENRELPFVALIAAKNGPKLPPANAAVEPRQVGPQIPGRISHPRMSMSILATLLSRLERQLVIDMTGLSGTFSIGLQWTPDALRTRVAQDGGAPLVNGQAVDAGAPSLPTALQEQLGLRLESRKGPVDVVVVDHAEKVPEDN
jgi:uncharacterized protein (TIGR03435 family)